MHCDQQIKRYATVLLTVLCVSLSFGRAAVYAIFIIFIDSLCDKRNSFRVQGCNSNCLEIFFLLEEKILLCFSLKINFSGIL